MKRCVVTFRDGSYANIVADHLRICENDENVILAFNGENLVGAIDMSAMFSLYISEEKPKT